MKDYWKILKVVMAAVVILGCLGIVLMVNSSQARSDEASEAMDNQDYFKEFTLKGIDGQVITQDDVKANKVTVFNGWAPWCTPCTGEMPDLEALSREYEGTGLKIVGLVADYYEKQQQQGDMEKYNSQIRDVVASTGVTYPIVVSDKKFHDALYVTISGFPTTWAVDSEGNIIECISGAKKTEVWREYFDKWLESVK